MYNLNWELNQNHRQELLREAQNLQLARLAASHNNLSVIRSLLFRAGRQLITVGHRLQQEQTILTTQPAVK
jgi:hypothetical protein